MRKLLSDPQDSHGSKSTTPGLLLPGRPWWSSKSLRRDSCPNRPKRTALSGAWLDIVLIEAHLSLLEMEEFEQRHHEDEEVREVHCSLATGHSPLPTILYCSPLTPERGVFSAQLSSQHCFSLLPLPKKPSPVSRTFPNSSNSLYLSHSNRPQLFSSTNPTNTHPSLVLSNHSPAYLPFHKPSYPFSICLSLNFPSTHQSLHLST